MGNNLNREYCLELRFNGLSRTMDALKMIDIGGRYYYLQEKGEKSEEIRKEALDIAKTFLKKPIGVKTLVVKVSLED